MKKIMIAVTLFAAALNIVSCNPKELLNPMLELSYVIIDGDTIKTRDDKEKDKLFKNKHSIYGSGMVIVGDTFVLYKEPKFSKPNKLEKLNKLKNQIDPDLKGKPFRMVTIGGAVAAGFRDGGWFNEGMITSYPNLIANQMGIKYDLPLFDAADYNGSERKVYTRFNPTGGPVPKVKSVSNNSAVLSYDPNVYSKVKLKQITMGTDSYVIPVSWSYRRFGDMPAKDVIGEELKKNKKFDFFILETSEFGTDIMNDRITKSSLQDIKDRDYKMYPEEGFKSKFTGFSDGVPNEYDNLVRRLSNKGIKNGIIINQPDLLKYAGWYNKQYRTQVLDIMKLYNVTDLYGPIRIASNTNNLGDPKYRVNGSSYVDSLLAPNVNVAIKRGLSQKFPATSFEGFEGFPNNDQIQTANGLYNASLKVYADYLNVPIFDMNGLYKKIWEGNFVTDEGVKVVGKWPEGNFYSADGIYPTPFGQAIIANEIIKTINTFYKMQIPLLSTKEFLNK
jgi:hypothetical protein